MRFNIPSIKERIAMGEALSPDERNFVFDCIAEATLPLPPVKRHNPPNYFARIEHLYAALSVDECGEGLCAAPFGAITLPLIATDETRLKQIIPAARATAKTLGKPGRLVRFSGREDVDTYQP